MDLAFIEQLLDLMGRAPVNELELERDGWRIRLSKAVTIPAAPVASATTWEQESSVATTPAALAVDGELKAVKAGLTGVFYRAPAPGQHPFVAIGDLVVEGQKLGILEAMKTLIPVEADCSGRITAILVDDGTPVQMGETLFMIDPADRE